jgi:sugar phosphate isomerase/epimerase
MMAIDMDRREFLRNVTAISASLAVGAAAGRAAVGAESRFGRWPVGIQSYSLRKFPVDEAIRHVEGLELHNLEFFSGHLPLEATQQQIDQMLATLGRSQIQLRAHGVNGFTADEAKNRAVFEFAKKAGFRNITANPEPDSFDSLERLVDEFDIRICIHNHGPGALYDKLEDVTNAVKGRHKHIGACIDTGHTLRSNEDPIEWVKSLGPRVFALHLKDVAEKTARTHDVVIGTAHLRLVDLFRSLRDAGFPDDGSISLEYESNPDNPIDDIKQCLVAAAEAIAQV